MAYTNLTSEQLNVLNFATSGHNVCIFGRAGVGKSTVVQEIRSKLQKQGKKCQIVCASGIACEAYQGLAKTVHSHYGLQTAELPQKLLLERCFERMNVVKQIEDTDVLIWDEISMSSRRLLNLVNILHQKCSKNSFPFGGIQVILVGDFWQLKPIQSVSDKGHPVYESQMFREIFCHRFELTKILRQEEDAIRLKEALETIRNGQCDEKTEKYFCSLSREFPSSPDNTSPTPVHLYFKRLPVEVHNSSVLASLPGPKLTFESMDTGNAKSLDRTVSAVLHLKPGCKVMLLYNINQQLKNGSCGKFVDVCQNGEALLLDFPNVGLVSVERKVWYKYDKNGNVEASRTQFPLILSYAITAHKSQGITMNQTVVHCSPEFIPGQTYVAISRVKHEDDLRVVGFRKHFLMPPPQSLTEFVTTSIGDPVPSYSCCRKFKVDGACSFDVEENQGCYDHENGSGESSSSNELLEFEAAAQKCFESAEGVPVNLEDVLLCLSDFSHELSHPPSDFSIKQFLEIMLSDTSDDLFSVSIKSAANFALTNLKTFDLLACVLWYT